MRVNARRIVIFGAMSDIAGGVAQLYAKQGSRFMLVGRNEEELTARAAELKELGAENCAVFVADLRQRDVHDAIIRATVEQLGTIDVALIAHGVYPDMLEAEKNVDVALDVFVSNALSTISIMHRLANVMSAAGTGVLAVISSVAGERGRRNNYIYGASKSAVTQYASGLRASVRDSGLHVLTIKPGPVDTHLTSHKNVPLKASVSRVVKDIALGIENREHTVYTPWYWRYLSVVIRLMPEWIFMRIKR